MSKRKPQQEWLIGSLSPSKEGRNYVLPPQHFQPVTRVCNASSRDPLPPTRMQSVRPGADDHKRHPSRGPF